MKFNMMIGGVETIFPEADVRYFKEDKEIVIYFLKTDNKNAQRISKNINKTKLKLEGNYLVLIFKDFQYAYNLEQSPKLIELYASGNSIGFAFEDENGKILDIATPTFSNET